MFLDSPILVLIRQQLFSDVGIRYEQERIMNLKSITKLFNTTGAEKFGEENVEALRYDCITSAGFITRSISETRKQHCSQHVS
jgi:hypothetical protein